MRFLLVPGWGNGSLMLIGIMADTHNDVGLTVRALRFCTDKNVEVILHAGDLTSANMLDYFVGFRCYFVLGNGDLIDEREINARALSLNFEPVQDKLEIELDGRKFIMFHGNNVPMFRDAVASGRYNYIIKGHTHFFENYVSNGARVINPGSVYGHDESTIAILDTSTDKVEKITIVPC